MHCIKILVKLSTSPYTENNVETFKDKVLGPKTDLTSAVYTKWVRIYSHRMVLLVVDGYGDGSHELVPLEGPVLPLGFLNNQQTISKLDYYLYL